jgi:hypothetical protein
MDSRGSRPCRELRGACDRVARRPAMLLSAGTL